MTDGICSTWLHWFMDGDDHPCQCGEFPDAAALLWWNREGYKASSPKSRKRNR